MKSLVVEFLFYPAACVVMIWFLLRPFYETVLLAAALLCFGTTIAHIWPAV